MSNKPKSLKNYVIYTSKSENCMRLLRNMNHCGVLSLFEQYDIRYKPIPTGVTHIPVLIIANVSAPLVGEKAFEWVDNTRIWKDSQDRIKKSVENNKNEWSKLQKPLVSDKKLLAYEESTMGSFSDKFSPIMDGYYPQSYANASEDVSIFTEKDLKENKVDKQKQEVLVNDYIQKRTDQDAYYKKGMDMLLENLKLDLVNK